MPGLKTYASPYSSSASTFELPTPVALAKRFQATTANQYTYCQILDFTYANNTDVAVALTILESWPSNNIQSVTLGRGPATCKMLIVWKSATLSLCNDVSFDVFPCLPPRRTMGSIPSLSFFRLSLPARQGLTGAGSRQRRRHPDRRHRDVVPGHGGGEGVHDR